MAWTRRLKSWKERGEIGDRPPFSGSPHSEQPILLLALRPPLGRATRFPWLHAPFELRRDVLLQPLITNAIAAIGGGTKVLEHSRRHGLAEQAR